MQMPRRLLRSVKIALLISVTTCLYVFYIQTYRLDLYLREAPDEVDISGATFVTDLTYFTTPFNSSNVNEGHGPTMWDIDSLYSSPRKTITSPLHIFKIGQMLVQDSLLQDRVKYIKPTNDTHLVNEIRLAYDEFTVKDPNFISEVDEKLFWSNQMNSDVGGKITDKAQLTGVIKLIQNAVYAPRINCGWKSVLDKFTDKLGSRFSGQATERGILYCPLLIPDGNAFQHFLDGTTPKLVQALPFLLQQNVHLIIYNYGSNPVIPAILSRLGINHTNIRLTSKRNEEVRVKYQLNTCITPPLHPLLWQTLHTLIGAPWTLEGPKEKTLVILLSRERALNAGRHITNRPVVEKYLQTRYGERYHSMHGDCDLEEAYAVFGRAAIIIGVHGGAFYNLNFSPKDTKIVELMPVFMGRYNDVLAHTIVWRMADALGQEYWRINHKANNFKGDITLDIHLLQEVLDKVDSK